MFDATSGVLQGVDEDGFRLKSTNGRRHPAVTLTALAYASDVAITSDSASGAERTIRRYSFIQRG